jgi:C1A family cysteine protease
MDINSKAARKTHGLRFSVFILSLIYFVGVAPFVSAQQKDAATQELEQLKKQFSDPKYKFTLRISAASRLPLSQITGLKLSQEAEVKKQAKSDNARAKKWLATEQKNLGAKAEKVSPTCARASSYDLRKVGLVSSPIKEQSPKKIGSCGSCWDFAALAALESSWKKINGQDVVASEQQILSCARAAGSCEGGLYTSVFLHLMFEAIPSSADVPYRAKRMSCNREVTTPYSASIFGWVHAFGMKPSVSEIKKAICARGAIAVGVYVSTAFKYYGGGVFNEMNNSHSTNHAVALIGWDDSKHAWLVRNSWGTDWGEKCDDPSSTRGYMWIDYDSNRIGSGAAWVKARKACPGEGDYDAGLCYKRCRKGYHGLGPVCWANCPEGYVSDGATCRVPISSIAKKSKGRGAGKPMACGPNEDKDGGLCYRKCRAGYKGVGPVCWAKCPEGYKDDGATCRKDVDIQKKDSYGRGVGKPLPCKKNRQRQAGLCYKRCRDGYKGVGPVCWKKCPKGYKDDGATCRKNAHIMAKKSYGRGVGKPLHACPAGMDKDGALCYPPCPVGYSGVGPVCWKRCPADYRDDGAFCTKGGKVIPASGSYGRGVGRVPP